MENFAFIDSVSDQIEYYSYLVYEGHNLSADQRRHLRELREMLCQREFDGFDKWINEIDNLLN